MAGIDVCIVADHARLTPLDLPGGSARFSPAAIDTSVERASPRMVVQRFRSEGRSGLLPYLMCGTAFVIGLALLATPAAFLGVVLCLLGVVWATISWSFIGSGRPQETLEVDARYLTVTRGAYVFVWPTAQVTSTLRVADSRPRLGPRARLIGSTSSLPGGRIEWGQAGSRLYGSFAPDMTREHAAAVVNAIGAFLTDHEPEPAGDLIWMAMPPER